MAEIIARGVRFHVQRLTAGGGAPVVVFVHGLLVDNLSSFYHPLAVPMHRAGVDVVLYDHRGHGLSSRPASGYTVEDAVDDLAALLAGLGVDRPVHLVGNSYGGVIALRAAVRRPDLVAALALLDAHEALGDGSDWLEDMVNSLTVAAWRFTEHDVPDQLLRAFGRRARKTARMAATVDALLNGTTLIDDLAALRPLDPAELAAVRCPVLAVYGEHSDLRAAGDHLARTLPRCRLVTLPGLSHTILREGVDLIRPLLLDWVPVPPSRADASAAVSA